MYSRLKKEIEKEFNKEMSYDTIMSKIEKKGKINSTKTKYILVPICALLIGILRVY